MAGKIDENQKMIVDGRLIGATRQQKTSLPQFAQPERSVRDRFGYCWLDDVVFGFKKELFKLGNSPYQQTESDSGN